MFFRETTRPFGRALGLVLALVFGCGLSGCELIVRFDESRLDTGSDAASETGSDASLDAQPADTQPADSAAMVDGRETTPPDAGAAETAPSDAPPADGGAGDVVVESGADAAPGAG